MTDALGKACTTISPRFIFLSSGGCTYTGSELPFQEGDQAFGINAYGRMKIEQEKYLEASLPNTVVARLSNIYGPGQPSGRGQGVIAEWLSAVQSSRNLKIYGDMNSARDYLHIDDATSALKLLARTDINGLINIGSGARIELNELVDIFLEVSPVYFDIEFHNRRTSDRLDYWLSIDKIRSELNWSPIVSIENGILSLIRTLDKK